MQRNYIFEGTNCFKSSIVNEISEISTHIVLLCVQQRIFICAADGEVAEGPSVVGVQGSSAGGRSVTGVAGPATGVAGSAIGVAGSATGAATTGAVEGGEIGAANRIEN